MRLYINIALAAIFALLGVACFVGGFRHADNFGLSLICYVLAGMCWRDDTFGRSAHDTVKDFFASYGK